MSLDTQLSKDKLLSALQQRNKSMYDHIKDVLLNPKQKILSREMPGSWPISEEVFVIQLSFVVNFFCPQINIFSLFKHMFYPCKKFYIFPATGVRTSNFTLPKAENDDFVESVITSPKVEFDHFVKKSI